MVFKVTALEYLDAAASVSVLFNDNNQIYCRKSLPGEPPDAIAARVIVKDDSVDFDTGRDTNDLLRPRPAAYEIYQYP
jgi:hypothetical protein